jgi:hypothetical protein
MDMDETLVSQRLDGPTICIHLVCWFELLLMRKHVMGAFVHIPKSVDDRWVAHQKLRIEENEWGPIGFNSCKPYTVNPRRPSVLYLQAGVIDAVEVL